MIRLKDILKEEKKIAFTFTDGPKKLSMFVTIKQNKLHVLPKKTVDYHSYVTSPGAVDLKKEIQTVLHEAGIQVEALENTGTAPGLMFKIKSKHTLEDIADVLNSMY